MKDTPVANSKPDPPVTVGQPAASVPSAAPASLNAASIKRRSSRVAIDIPVEILGQQVNGKMFHEETRTTVVSAHGALLTLRVSSQIKPSVLMIHKKTRAEAQCRVIFLKESEQGKAELGVEFVTPQPRFWGIAFPPEDWNSAERKKPGSQNR